MGVSRIIVELWFIVGGAYLIIRRREITQSRLNVQRRFRSRLLRYPVDSTEFDPRRLGECGALVVGVFSIFTGSVS
jgi:hypothetical protein